MVSYFLSLGCTSLTQRQASEFFAQESEKNEAFRIFIGRDMYRVEQVDYFEQIKRQDDEKGDKEKKEFFTKEHDRISYSDFIIQGTLAIGLSPYSGKPTNIQYVPDKTPSTWQASKHFIQDISRFRFDFPDPKKKLLHFHVSYFWSVITQHGLTSAGRKQKAIEYLRSQKRR